MLAINRIILAVSAMIELIYATPSLAECITLSQLGQGTEPQVIYLWSPRMVGSVIEAHHAAQAAKQNGAKFIALLDPRVDAAEARAALSTRRDMTTTLSATRTICEDVLPEHALDHAPTMYVMSHGKLHPHRIIGLMPQNEWRRAMQRRIKDLHHAS